MKSLCRKEEQSALAFAQRAADPEIRRAWERIADRWRKIAALFPGPCFCGRPSAGTQRCDDGARKALCSDHLHKALLRGAQVEFALANDG